MAFIIDDEDTIELPVKVVQKTSNMGVKVQSFGGVYRKATTDEVRDVLEEIRSTGKQDDDYDSEESEQRKKDIAGIAERFMIGAKDVWEHKKDPNGEFIRDDKGNKIAEMVSDVRGLQIVLKWHEASFAAGNTYISDYLFQKEEQNKSRKGR
jgi:hypothetical protein